jgi:hypothetical protein
MGQFERQSEAPLRIASLYFEFCTFASAAPGQFKPPSGAANARHWQRRTGQCTDPPTRRRRGRLPELSCFNLPPPSPQRQANHAGVLCGELKSARGGHGEVGNFRNDRAELAVAQGFLETGKDGFVISCFDINDPVRRKSSLR